MTQDSLRSLRKVFFDKKVATLDIVVFEKFPIQTLRLQFFVLNFFETSSQTIVFLS